MPHEDDEAAELQHAQEVRLVIFPAGDQSAEVMQPGEEVSTGGSNDAVRGRPGCSSGSGCTCGAR